MQTILSMPSNRYKNLINHLLPKGQRHEQAAFVFANSIESSESLTFEYRDNYLVPSGGFSIQSAYHIELNDQTRAMVIKRAHDLNACLIEFHSHLSYEEPRFSGSDIAGFSEFVPHVRWRLKGRPYAAVVVSKSGFDALVWHDTAEPETLNELRVGTKVLQPSGATLHRENFE
jgi:hypothetical protein